MEAAAQPAEATQAAVLQGCTALLRSQEPQAGPPGRVSCEAHRISCGFLGRGTLALPWCHTPPLPLPLLQPLKRASLTEGGADRRERCSYSRQQAQQPGTWPCRAAGSCSRARDVCVCAGGCEGCNRNGLPLQGGRCSRCACCKLVAKRLPCHAVSCICSRCARANASVRPMAWLAGPPAAPAGRQRLALQGLARQRVGSPCRRC